MFTPSKEIKTKNIVVTRDFVLFWNSIFSQWCMCSFRDPMLDLEFSSAEQYMMYHKAILFDDNSAADQIMASDSPRKQKSIGSGIQNYDNSTWDVVAMSVVTRGNVLKFSQNPELLEQMMQLSDKEFVEASPLDAKWGIGLHYEDELAKDRVNWKGENLLGICLNRAMEIIKDEKEVNNA